jgi:hypothetical protein
MATVFGLFAAEDSMPQLHLYVSDVVAREVQRRAREHGLSVSAWLAQLVRGEIGTGWPEGWFDDVLGGWQGESLERGPQGEPESREEL